MELLSLGHNEAGKTLSMGELEPQPVDPRDQQITDLAADLDMWKDLALKDPLTGLATRHAQELRFDELRQAGKPLGLIIFDVKNFDWVNNQYSYGEGDDKLVKTGTLIETARIVEGNIRENDLVGRLGGDEFLLLLDLSDKRTEDEPDAHSESDKTGTMQGIAARIERAYARDNEIVEYNSRKGVPNRKKLGLRSSFAIYDGGTFEELKRQAEIVKDKQAEAAITDQSFVRRVAVRGLYKVLDAIDK